MIQSLIDFKVDGCVVKWMIGFISGRMNCVRVNGLLSPFANMARGLIQGFLNGPLTFICLFDKLLEKLNTISNASISKGFVDYVTALSVERDPAFLLAQNVLMSAEDGVDEIGMSLNTKKTQVMVTDFTRNNQSSLWEFHLGNSTIDTVNTVKLLGVHLSNKLTWDDHVNEITSKAGRRLWALRRLAQFGFSEKELVTFYKSTIRSVVEYAAPLWTSAISKALILDLERVQERAVRIIVERKLTDQTTWTHSPE